MNYVVVPLSRATPPPFIPAWFIDGLLAHILLVGLLPAFLARWSARRAQAGDRIAGRKRAGQRQVQQLVEMSLVGGPVHKA
ncbi:MAG: hypothetical protein ACRETI_08200 [Steroidobacteraceae bacterium]